ncbi:MAG: tetratricopeptide repeat protein [Cytophagales bacterium]|nr:tetratricopeptide repeat protein [Cytophagales bacterium]
MAAWYHPARKVAKAPKGLLSKKSSFKKWRQFVPHNYDHLYFFLQGQVYASKGRLDQAIRYFERAVESAKNNENLFVEGMAWERLGNMAQLQDRRLWAGEYLAQAYGTFAQWGSKNKMAQLRLAYGNFFQAFDRVDYVQVQSSQGGSSSYSAAQPSASLDLTSILKASQAISSEIKLERLLRSLIGIVIENAGAEKGFLLLPEGQDWKVRVRANIQNLKNKKNRTDYSPRLTWRKP